MIGVLLRCDWNRITDGLGIQILAQAEYSRAQYRRILEESSSASAHACLPRPILRPACATPMKVG
jgi:hypothetical protein